MIIRQMTVSDIKEASQIAASSMLQPWSMAAFAAELKNAQALLLVCEADDAISAADDFIRTASGGEEPSDSRISGYISLLLTPDDAELTGIAVKEAARRQGMAGALLKEARSILRKRGIGSIVLEVRASNTTAVSFYEKHGFTCIGVRRGLYDFPKEDALVMTDMKE